MLAILDVAFFVFHTALILFNVLGWIPRKLRRWNLATLLATLFSWTIMGLWFGRGYCVCTDLHWRVRRAMGINETSDSYLVLLVRSLTGWDPPVPLVSGIAFWVFLFCILMSIGLNLRDWKSKNRSTRAEVEGSS